MKHMKIKRVFAWIIDIFLCFYVFYIPIIYLPGNITKNYEMIDRSLSPLFFLLFLSSFCAKDLLFKNQSIGKKIFGIAIYNEQDNSIPNKVTLVKRGFISFCVNFVEALALVVINKSVGDCIFKTKVRCKK